MGNKASKSKENNQETKPEEEDEKDPEHSDDNDEKQELSPPKSSKKEHEGFKAIVAVDFGTDGIGLAFTFGENEEIFHGQQIWRENQKDCRTDRQIPKKTKTSILLDFAADVSSTLAFGTFSLRR